MMNQAQGGKSLPRASGIVVAGGASRRMRRDKAFVDLNGKPLIARVIEQVRAVCSETIIVANNQQAFAQYGVPVIGDAYPGKGSLGGIFTGLQAAREPYALAVACDMPFLDERLLRYLISLAPGFDVVVPRAHDPSSRLRRVPNATMPRAGKPTAKERDLHPLHAVYAKSCLEPMHARLQKDDLRTIGFFETVKVRIVEAQEIDRFDPLHLSFFNVNTPEDLAYALDLAR
jgi:molybdopterin-guanine dinucleotide biosynthesis protein A